MKFQSTFAPRVVRQEVSRLSGEESSQSCSYILPKVMPFYVAGDLENLVYKKEVVFHSLDSLSLSLYVQMVKTT